jgi:hypothetical protein
MLLSIFYNVVPIDVCYTFVYRIWWLKYALYPEYYSTTIKIKLLFCVVLYEQNYRNIFVIPVITCIAANYPHLYRHWSQQCNPCWFLSADKLCHAWSSFGLMRCVHHSRHWPQPGSTHGRSKIAQVMKEYNTCQAYIPRKLW